MLMAPYPVMCYAAGCAREAVYKVAAHWSDGTTGELKTYYLSCAGCLSDLYREASLKRNRCRMAPGETLSEPAIFLLVRGERDRKLIRCEELETKINSLRE